MQTTIINVHMHVTNRTLHVTYMRRIRDPHCQFESYAYAPDAAVMNGSSSVAIMHTRRRMDVLNHSAASGW